MTWLLRQRVDGYIISTLHNSIPGFRLHSTSAELSVSRYAALSVQKTKNRYSSVQPVRAISLIKRQHFMSNWLLSRERNQLKPQFNSFDERLLPRKTPEDPNKATLCKNAQGPTLLASSAQST